MLDAVLRYIEMRENAVRKNDGGSPDNPQDPDPDPLRRVDYICTVGRFLYAFEHTRIEPFIDQIRLEKQNRKLFDPIIEHFNHRADREVWDLYVPVEASAGLTTNDVGGVQDALIKWVEANAARIPVVPRYGQRANSLSWEEAEGVPFRLSLRRTISQVNGSPLDGRFFLRPIAPCDLEEQRVARLQTVCMRKFPKLAKWKQGSGARTVLVLEEDDLFLTNHFLVSYALAQAEAMISEAPDEVFLVSTDSVKTWWVVCLRGPGLVAGEPSPNYEFDPMSLSRVTSR